MGIRSHCTSLFGKTLAPFKPRADAPGRFPAVTLALYANFKTQAY